MATVYRGHDRRLGRDVAVKIIHRHLRENREVAQRFASEAKAVAKVKHPNIVEVYDVSDEQDAERYLVVELIRGTTLRKLLVDRGHLPAEIAACIGIEIARALDHAHRHGVVHRDVKPENVLIAMPRVDEDGAKTGASPRVKITDFGIAKLLDAQGVTSTGQVLGSPAHMAPEQIEGGEVSGRSDVFGLGVALYECMVGVMPFEGKNPAQVLRRVLEGHFSPPDRARPSVGSSWSRIIEKALAHRSEDRYPSAGELADAMQAELDRLGFGNRRRELTNYLEDPEGYLAKYQERVVSRLTKLGREARDKREMPAAAGCFNRALAFRPDNTELLSEVAGLVRRQRLQRTIARVAGGAAALGVLLAAGLYGASWLGDRAVAKQPQGEQKSEPHKKAEPHVDKQQAPASREPAPSATPTKQRRSATARNRISRPKTLEEADAATDPVQERSVRILIDGPQNASVRIDGQQRLWYKPQKLSVGPHSFEFIPPNEECCQAPPPQTVEILEGEGPQTVRGRIPFKPAVLALNGAPGAKASCGVAGQLLAGEDKQIQLSTPTLKLSCHVFPPPGTADPPKEIDVTLSPGRTFNIAWP